MSNAASIAKCPFTPTALRHTDSGQPWKDQPTVGDRFEQCHELRDGDPFPHGGRTENVDVAVVGGGVSGLMAAQRLQKKHDVVVLEKDPRAGGNSKSCNWNGLEYPLGALYYSPPTPEINALFTEIGLTPQTIPGSSETLLIGGQYIPNIMGDGISQLPFPPATRQAFKDAWDLFASFNDSPDAPQVPVDTSTAKARELDAFTFQQYCRDKNMHPEVMKLVDQYVRSCWGVGSETVSAFAGINFLSAAFAPLCAFPGGNAAIASALIKNLGQRVRTGCFVDKVTQEDGKVRIDYIKDGDPQTIFARQVIMATPKHITRRAIPDLPEKLANAMSTVRYGAYLVGEVFMKQPLADEGFDILVPDRWYTDLCIADWMASNGHPSPSRQTVVTASIPMGGHDGRVALLRTPHDAFEVKLLNELDKDFTGIRDNVLGVQFARYGHPMVTPYPGYINNVTPVFSEAFGNIRFANSDAHGLACMESAFSSAMRAADDVEKALSGKV